MKHQLAGGNSSWRPELESRSTHCCDMLTVALPTRQIGRMLGAYWVGFATEQFGGYCAVWSVCTGLFVVMWVVLLWNWRGLDPVRRQLRVTIIILACFLLQQCSCARLLFLS